MLRNYKILLANKPLALIVDEIMYETSLSLLTIIATILEPELEENEPMLICTVFLKVVNNVSVGKSIISTVVQSGIKYDDIP